MYVHLWIYIFAFGEQLRIWLSFHGVLFFIFLTKDWRLDRCSITIALKKLAASKLQTFGRSPFLSHWYIILYSVYINFNCDFSVNIVTIKMGTASALPLKQPPSHDHQPRLNEVAQKFLADLAEESQWLSAEFPLCALLIAEGKINSALYRVFQWY